MPLSDASSDYVSDPGSDFFYLSNVSLSFLSLKAIPSAC